MFKATSMDMQPGLLLDEKYEILSALGEGGFSRVYIARQLDCQRVVAIKLLRSELAADQESRKRFLRECKALSSLDHPNILKIYAMGLWLNKVPYMVTELVQGTTLRFRLQEQGVQEIDEVRRIAQQCALALEEAHRCGVIHRDIKPENIIFNEQGDLKLIDFGLALYYPPDHVQEQKLTSTGMLMGTANYMSPEQGCGQPTDARSDIYSLCCVLYECINGNPPFQADTFVGILYKHKHEEVPEFTGNCEASLKAAVLKGLAKQPTDRFQSAREFSLAVGKGSHDESAASVKKTQVLVMALASFGIFVLISVMSAKTWSHRQSEPGNSNTFAPGSTSLNSASRIRKSIGVHPDLPHEDYLLARYSPGKERINALEKWLAVFGKQDADGTTAALFLIWKNCPNGSPERRRAGQAAIARFNQILKNSGPHLVNSQLAVIVFHKAEIESSFDHAAAELTLSGAARVWAKQLSYSDAERMFEMLLDLPCVHNSSSRMEMYSKSALLALPNSILLKTKYARGLCDHNRKAQAAKILKESARTVLLGGGEIEAVAVANELLKEDMYSEAILFIRSYLRRSPQQKQNAELLLALGDALCARSQFSEAADCLLLAWHLQDNAAFGWKAVDRYAQSLQGSQRHRNICEIVGRQLGRSSDLRTNLDGLCVLTENLKSQEEKLYWLDFTRQLVDRLDSATTARVWICVYRLANGYHALGQLATATKILEKLERQAAEFPAESKHSALACARMHIGRWGIMAGVPGATKHLDLAIADSRVAEKWRALAFLYKTDSMLDSRELAKAALYYGQATKCFEQLESSEKEELEARFRTTAASLKGADST
ncbi:MAG: serine/threonine protein kinase [Candidatus Obscuribacterales bacterium]|nr:serine/threonine protein kinase [Candidatus Obscuribacterales bacterium]